MTPEYRAWRNILGRCHSPTNDKFKYYGGRGITVCPEWRHDFAAFLAHVGTRPSDAHTIDRIDNARGYEPGNVRWATRDEQARNKRNNRVIEWRGERRSLAEWCEATGITYDALVKRLNRGWPLDQAMTQPVHARDE